MFQYVYSHKQDCLFVDLPFFNSLVVTSVREITQTVYEEHTLQRALYLFSSAIELHSHKTVYLSVLYTGQLTSFLTSQD